jgi:hypothetical protein
MRRLKAASDLTQGQKLILEALQAVPDMHGSNVPAPIPDAGEGLSDVMRRADDALSRALSAQKIADEANERALIALESCGGRIVSALQANAMVVPDGWTVGPSGSKTMCISYCGVGMSFNEDEPDRRIVWLVDFLRAIHAASPAPGDSQ